MRATSTELETFAEAVDAYSEGRKQKFRLLMEQLRHFEARVLEHCKVYWLAYEPENAIEIAYVSELAQAVKAPAQKVGR